MTNYSPVSIFNDVIGPVMRGPSSSHCAAALRIGRLARDLMDGEITDVLVEFDRSGSLPTTHESQGSDMGLFGGLLGWGADDERLPDSSQALAEAGIALRIETVDVSDPHPNTYRITLRNRREQHALIAISTGGGMMEVIALDGLPLHMDGGYHETLVWLPKGIEPHFDADEVIRQELADSVLWQVKAARFVSTDELNPIAVKRLSPVLPVPSRKNITLPFTSGADKALHVLSTFDEGPDLVLYYKQLMVLEGHAAYEHHFNPTDQLSPSQREFLHQQWSLFKTWWNQWPGANRL